MGLRGCPAGSLLLSSIGSAERRRVAGFRIDPESLSAPSVGTSAGRVLVSQKPLWGEMHCGLVEVAIAGPETQGDTWEKSASLCHDKKRGARGEKTNAT